MKKNIIWLFFFLVLPTNAVSETVAERSFLLVRQGAAALLRGKFENAIKAYDQALEYDKLSPIRKASIHSDRGVAYWRMKQTGNALADFGKAAQINPKYPQVFNNMGNVYMDLNRHADAVEAYSRAIELAPTYGVAYNNRGSAHLELGKSKEAIHDFSLAVRYLSTNAIPHNGRGRAYLSKGKNYAAVRDFTRAVKINKAYGMVFLSRARAYANLKQHYVAVKDYTHAIKLARMEPQLYFERGQSYQGIGKFPTAISDFTKTIDLAPGHAQAYALRGMAFARLKKYEKALIDANKAIELDPTNSLGYLTRGKIAKRKGEYESALEDLKTALEINKDQGEALKLIAQINEVTENKEEAIVFYQRSLASDRFSSGSRAGLKRLTGDLPSLAGVPIGDIVDGWSLSQLPDGQYYVTHDKYPNLYGYIETYGAGEPRLLEYIRLKGKWKKFGLLRYAAGSLGEGDASLALEYTAIIDFKQARITAIEPYQWGDKKAQWKWGNGFLTVSDPDGMVSEIYLTKPSRVAAQRNSADGASWRRNVGAPSRRASSRKARRRAAKRKRSRRRRNNKSIMDWLFQ